MNCLNWGVWQVMHALVSLRDGGSCAVLATCLDTAHRLWVVLDNQQIRSMPVKLVWAQMCVFFCKLVPSRCCHGFAARCCTHCAFHHHSMCAQKHGGRNRLSDCTSRSMGSRRVAVAGFVPVAYSVLVPKVAPDSSSYCQLCTSSSSSGGADQWVQ